MPPKPRRRWLRWLLWDGVRPYFVLGDAAACVVAAAVEGSPKTPAATFTLILLALFSGAGLYRSRLSLSLLDDMLSLIHRWLVAAGLVMVATAVWWGVRPDWAFALLALPLVLLVRGINYFVVRLLRSKQLIAHPTVVVGSDSTARRLVDTLSSNTQCGLAPLGFLDISSEDDLALPAPLLGAPIDLLKVLEQLNPTVVILGLSALPEPEMVRLVRACHRNRCEVFVIPRLYELQHGGADVEFVWDIPLVRLRRAVYRSRSWRLKRPFDLTFALLALVVLSPLMAACALGVYLEGGSGVIYRQERVGRDGRRFFLLKFRSLRPLSEGDDQTRWTIANDPRLGRIGRLLRISSLDELPQLFNVIRGDMSLVGPRPERPHFVAEFDGLYQGYNDRHRVPSGLTGWAQVHGLRGDTSIMDRIRFDNFYIENWSLWLDFKILLRTVVSVVRSPGT